MMLKDDFWIFLFHLCMRACLCRQSSVSAWFSIASLIWSQVNLSYFFCFIFFFYWNKISNKYPSDLSKNSLKKILTTTLVDKFLVILAKITKTLTPMVQSAIPTICNIIRMCECKADYLFEKKKVPKWMLLKFY